MKNKILVVDDDEHIAQLVQINLERAGYQVRTAGDGMDALELLEVEHPDLMILDVMMPRLSGFELLRKIKADPATKHIPVIMLTVRSGDTDVSDGLIVGVDVYLSKPFDPGELLSFVARFLPCPAG